MTLFQELRGFAEVSPMKKVEARVSKKGMGTASFNAGYGVGTIFPALLLISAFFGVLI